jgi:hypothetical protein
MTRFWANGEPIAVSSDAKRQPVMIHWQGRRERVADILSRWRVDEDWWRTRIWREYLLLVTESGRLLLIYCDLLADRWYVQRLYD